MSIVKRTVFCEGKSDEVFFYRLFKRFGVSVTVKGAGGIHGLNAIASFEARRTKNEDYLIVHDRDFRTLPPSPQLLLRNKNNCTLARTCIENYVLDPRMIRMWWTDISNSVDWKFGQAPSEEQIGEWIKLGVKKIEAYQIARWSLASLVPSEGFPTIKSTWSRELPKDLSEESCLKQATRMIEAFAESRKDLNTRFEQYYEEYKKRFQSPQFLEDKGYLMWFSGKDLKAALGEIKLIPQGSIPTYTTYMEAAADYLNIAEHPDLAELVQLAKDLG
jgi:hypothetical protein